MRSIEDPFGLLAAPLGTTAAAPAALWRCRQRRLHWDLLTTLSVAGVNMSLIETFPTQSSRPAVVGPRRPLWRATPFGPSTQNGLGAAPPWLPASEEVATRSGASACPVACHLLFHRQAAKGLPIAAVMPTQQFYQEAPPAIPYYYLDMRF